MTLEQRWILAAVVFHTGLVLLGWRLLRTRARGVVAIAWGVAAAIVLPIWAALCSLLGPWSGFTSIHLLSQALFAEGPLVCAVLARRAVGRSLGQAMAWGSATAVLLGVYADAYHLEPEHLEIRRHAVDLSPGRVSGHVRIVHVSDLQIDRMTPRVARVLQAARDLQPDLVVWTGDFVQPRLQPTRPQAEADLAALLKRAPIPAPLGSYAVRGDVDVSWPDLLKGTGIVALSGDTVRLPLAGARSLTLVGLNSGTSRGGDPRALRQELGVPPLGDLVVTAGHNPDYVRLLRGLPHVDLALAGHTHGGQVVLPLVGALMTKTLLPARYASGLHDFEGVPVHVSAGVGMERGAAPQIRFRCPPEICLIDITY